MRCRFATCRPSRTFSTTGYGDKARERPRYQLSHAQFIQFRDKKVVDFVSIVDSFDAAEQLLGYNLDAYDGYRVEGNVVTV